MWSCDTLVALPDVTTDGRALLGKNSDRPVGETQPLSFLPRRHPAPGDRLRLAYVEIPEAGDAYAHLGASPYWCWGHETGLSEWGVAIGNEALFTRDLAANAAASGRGEPVPLGVLGMELVRLGLERGRSAEEAVQVMGELVERYGQWGSCLPGKPVAEGAYDNSYLVVDPVEAWVLETSGHRWVAKRVDHGTWAISNQPTIRRHWDAASTDLADHAVREGWWPKDAGAEFDFARAYADPGTPLQVSHIRLSRSRQLLAGAVGDGGVGAAQVKRILRDHYEDSFLGGPYFTAALPDFLTLCMHGHPAGFTWGNTASSSICVLPREGAGLPHVWWTPLTPCTGLYLPVFVHAAVVPEPLTRTGAAGGTGRPDGVGADSFSAGSYWWRFQQLLDTVKGDELGWLFDRRRPVVREAFDPLESRWVAEAHDVERAALRLLRQGQDAEASTRLAEFTESCVAQAVDAVAGLLGEFDTEAEVRDG